jgi:hypothetical protein
MFKTLFQTLLKTIARSMNININYNFFSFELFDITSFPRLITFVVGLRINILSILFYFVSKQRQKKTLLHYEILGVD